MQTITTVSPLSFTRAQKAKRPTKEEIQKQLDKANNNYINGQGKLFLPEIYTR